MGSAKAGSAQKHAAKNKGTNDFIPETLQWIDTAIRHYR
jgi:hypothetical protein